MKSYCAIFAAVVLLIAGLLLTPGPVNAQKSSAKDQEKSQKTSATDSQESADKKGQASAADARQGAATFKAKCAVCHGADGSGNTQIAKKLNIRDLRSSEVQKRTDAQLFEITAQGKGQMPGYLKTLGHDKIHQVVAYLRELAKKS